MPTYDEAWVSLVRVISEQGTNRIFSRLIGKGACADAYVVEHQGYQFVVKISHKEFLSQEKLLQIEEQERLMHQKALANPNGNKHILKAEGVQCPNGTRVMVSEYMSATSVDAHASSKNWELEPIEFIRALNGLVRGNVDAHNQGVTHLDNGCRNLFAHRDDKGRIKAVKLADFGFAIEGRDSGKEEQESAIGWRDPRWANEGIRSPATDWFQVARTIIELATGDPHEFKHALGINFADQQAFVETLKNGYLGNIIPKDHEYAPFNEFIDYLFTPFKGYQPGQEVKELDEKEVLVKLNQAIKSYLVKKISDLARQPKVSKLTDLFEMIIEQEDLALQNTLFQELVSSVAKIQDDSLREALLQVLSNEMNTNHELIAKIKLPYLDEISSIGSEKSRKNYINTKLQFEVFLKHHAGQDNKIPLAIIKKAQKDFKETPSIQYRLELLEMAEKYLEKTKNKTGSKYEAVMNLKNAIMHNKSIKDIDELANKVIETSEQAQKRGFGRQDHADTSVKAAIIMRQFDRVSNEKFEAVCFKKSHSTSQYKKLMIEYRKEHQEHLDSSSDNLFKPEMFK